MVSSWSRNRLPDLNEFPLSLSIYASVFSVHGLGPLLPHQTTGDFHKPPNPSRTGPKTPTKQNTPGKTSAFMGDRFFPVLVLGIVLSLWGCQTPAQHWIKIVHPSVQKLYPILGVGVWRKAPKAFPDSSSVLDINSVCEFKSTIQIDGISHRSPSGRKPQESPEVFHWKCQEDSYKWSSFNELQTHSTFAHPGGSSLCAVPVWLVIAAEGACACARAKQSVFDLCHIVLLIWGCGCLELADSGLFATPYEIMLGLHRTGRWEGTERRTLGDRETWGTQGLKNSCSSSHQSQLYWKAWWDRFRKFMSC